MFIGLSNKLSDIDNVAKQFIDILSKAYNFNDNQIYSLVMQKEIVNK
jgi:Holliday junction resolvase RusA-like endonuclease